MSPDSRPASLLDETVAFPAPGTERMRLERRGKDTERLAVSAESAESVEVAGSSDSADSADSSASSVSSVSSVFSFDSNPDTSSSRRIGDYDVVEEIARGGMGVVYLARQRVLRRVVALKVLRSGDNASDEERERLLREAKAAAGLSHPNIVPIHEFSVHQGQPYFTMDYIEGQPLDRLLEKGPLKTRVAVETIAAVARAISYAHARGIIHRDLKPANIIINHEGRPMITDFGLAVEQTAETEKQRRMTMAGSIMGTIPYAPPEQASGKIDQIGPASDVYSMGAVLYEMVTGKPPFTGFTQFELLRRVINQDPVPPRQLNPKVHRDVETMILKCLEKEQRRRYASAKAFADDCASFLKGEVISARPATIVYRCRRFVTRRPLLNLLSAMVVILSLAVWIGLDHFRALAREKEQTEEVLRTTRAEAERIALEKEEADREVRRDWRTDFNVNFDYFFGFDPDLDSSRQRGLPWLNPENTRAAAGAPARAKLLADPPRLALTDPDGAGAAAEQIVTAAAGTGAEAGTAAGTRVDLGLPFVFPRESRVTTRIMTPGENVGELLLHLDVNGDYTPHPGTTTLRLGSQAHPGANFYRGATTIGEDAAFFMKPGELLEVVVERSDDRLRAFVNGAAVLEAGDPPPALSPNAGAGRVALNVKGGSLEFLDLAVELRGMSRNLAASLVDTANSLASRGRAELSLPLYVNVLLEPTDGPSRLRALRGYARSLVMSLPRRQRTPAGVERACQELAAQLSAAGRTNPGETDLLVGLALSSEPADGNGALDHFERAAALAYSAGDGGEGGDLARLESLFVYLRRGMLAEAARRFSIMYEDGSATRLYERFGNELGGGGRVALLLEKAEGLISAEDELATAATLLRAAAAIAPASRECANHFRRLGLVHARLGDSGRAVECQQWAQRMAPDWFAPYIDEARLHWRMGEAGNTERALERAAEAMPLSLELQLGIAELYLTGEPAVFQDPAKAEAAARSAVTLSQEVSPAAREWLALALMRQGRVDEAKEAVENALRLEETPARVKLRDEIELRIFSNSQAATTADGETP